MALTDRLISQFAKITNDKSKKKNESTVYGEVVVDEFTHKVTGVKLDGSDVVTPVLSTAGLKAGDRVTVMIKNHSAIVTGNISAPSTSESDVDFIITDKIDTEELNAAMGNIEELVVDNALIKGALFASEAEFDEFETRNATIYGLLTASEGEITSLKTSKLDTTVFNSEIGNIKDLYATNASVNNLLASYATVEKLNVAEGRIDTLSANKLDASVFNAEIGSIKEAYITTAKVTQLLASYATIIQLNAVDAKFGNLDSKYADIKLAKVDNADIGAFLAKVGLIDTTTMVNGHVTGFLDAVKINANNINAGTLTVDRLVISGSDKSILYELNKLGDLEASEFNRLEGGVIKERTITADHIVAGSITANEIHSNAITSEKILAGAVTASKISATSLESIVAKIGSFAINNAIYSNGHSAYNTAKDGVYLGSDYISLGNGGKTWLKHDGSVSIGNGALTYNTSTGALDIDATSIKMASKEIAMKTDIDDLEIGGRNYIRLKKLSSYAPYNSTPTYNRTIITTTRNSSNDTEYLTLSVSGFTPSNGVYTLSGYLKVNGLIPESNYFTTRINTYGSNEVRNIYDPVTGYFEFTQTYTDQKNFIIHAKTIETNASGSVVTFDRLKFEKGYKATDWTPAPEDIDSDISNASKTATNYLSFSSNGLVVGDHTSDTLGKNVLIGSDSVKIRSGTTENAVFGADIIELAKDNTTSTISMLKGEFKIYYHSDTEDGGFGIFGKTSDGEDRLAFQPVNQNGNLTLGYGGYKVGKNLTNIYGNGINLYAKNGVSIYTGDGKDFKINDRAYGKNQILWSGARFMTADHTITLSAKVSEQPNGIALVFSKYEDGEAKDFQYNVHFVPKQQVTNDNGGGHTFMMLSNASFATFAAKYLYIYDDKIVGQAANDDTGTGACGITYANNLFVLRYVIGI